MAEASPTCPQCSRPVPANATSCPFDGTVLPVFNPSGAKIHLAPDWNESTQVRALSGANSHGVAGTDRADPLIGATLGDYVVKQLLGSGGMGIVYEGEQPLIGKRVAIKIIRPEIAADQQNVARLLAEARAVNAIRHRGIIDIFNFGKLPDGRNYVVMEYLQGEALDAVAVRRGAMSPVEVIDILNEVLSALGAGHGAGIIHRDLKPSNIYVVTEANGQKYIKLLDFGLAKSSMRPGKAMTHTNVVVGTPDYMAPEQARAGPVSPQSDLYALGIIAFELLTGRLPFDARAPFEWMMHQVNTQPPVPSSVAGGIPPELDALVLALLAKKEADRPATAASVREQLARIRRSIVGGATQLDASGFGFRPADGVTGPKAVLTEELLDQARAMSTLPSPAPQPDMIRDAPVPPRASSNGAPAKNRTVLIAGALVLIGVLGIAGGSFVVADSADTQEIKPLGGQLDVVTPPPKPDDSKKVAVADPDPTKVTAADNDSDPNLLVDPTKTTHLSVQNASTKVDPKLLAPKKTVSRKAQVIEELKTLNARALKAENLKLEMGPQALVKQKLLIVKGNVTAAKTDKELIAAEGELRKIRKLHFR